MHAERVFPSEEKESAYDPDSPSPPVSPCLRLPTLGKTKAEEGVSAGGMIEGTVVGMHHAGAMIEGTRLGEPRGDRKIKYRTAEGPIRIPLATQKAPRCAREGRRGFPKAPREGNPLGRPRYDLHLNRTLACPRGSLSAR